MYCINCSIQIVDNSNFCLYCGHIQKEDNYLFAKTFLSGDNRKGSYLHKNDEYKSTIKSNILNKLKAEYNRMLFNQAYHILETNCLESPTFDYLGAFEKGDDVIRLIEYSKFDDNSGFLNVSISLFSEILLNKCDHYHSLLFSAIASLLVEPISPIVFESAIADINKAIQIKPTSAIGYFYRGFIVERFLYRGDIVIQFQVDNGNEVDFETRVRYFLADFIKAIQLGSGFLPRMFIMSINQIKRYAKYMIDFNSTLINYFPDEGSAYLQRGIERFYRNTYDGHNHISFYPFQAQDYQDIIDDLRKAIELSPELSEAYLYLAKTYSFVGIYRDEAKKDKTGALSRLLVDFVGGDNEAIEAYSMHIFHNPDSIDSYISRSRIYAFMHKYKNAIMDLDEVIKRREGYVIAYSLKAHYLIWDKQYDTAIVEKNKSIKLNSDLFDYWERGFLLLITNKVMEGMRDINHVLKSKIRAPSQYEFLNQSFFIDSLGNAIREFSNSIKEGISSANLYSYRGLAKYLLYEFLHNIPDAIEDCSKGIELEPSNPQLFYIRAVVYLSSGMKIEAIHDLTSYIMLTGGDCQVYFDRSKLLLETGNYQGAIADLKDSIMCNPKFMESYVSLGGVYYYLKDYKNALSAYVNASEIDNNEENYLARQAKMWIKAINLDLDESTYSEN